VMRRFFPTAERAARTTIYLATAAPLASVTGKYYRFMAEREPTLKRAPVNAGQRFWDVAARLTKADLEL
jgi:hypothetical protein